MIVAGTVDMDDARIGSEQVSAIFIGSQLVWRLGFNDLPSTVHFAANGNDMTGLGTIESPLKSIAVANAIPRSGKSLVFRGGDTFNGTLQAAPNCKHTSYGTGMARIFSGMAEGAILFNTPYTEVYGLEFEGAGVTLNPKVGIRATNLHEDATFIPGLVIRDNRVHEYGGDGVRVSARNYPSGFTNPKVNNNDVYDCVGNDPNGHTGGIIVYAAEPEHDLNKYPEIWGLGSNPPSFTDVEVKGNHVYRCYGTPGTPNHSGNGIIVAQTRTGIVEHNTVEDCGTNNTSQAGPVGAWTWDSIGVKIRKNTVKRQGSSGPDGGGFDIDGGCVDCILEYNLCIECQGPGILMYAFNDMASWPESVLRDFRRNVARYNISLRCGAGGFSKYGMFLGTGRPVTTDWKDCKVHNNTIVTDDVNGTKADNFVIFSYDGIVADHLTGVVTNNIFYHKGTGLLTDMRKNDIDIEGNVYFSTRNRPMRYYGFDWTDPLYWIDTSGSDNEPKEFHRNSMSLYKRDPMFIDDSSDDPAGYQPGPGSPIWGIGMDITEEYGIPRPTEDFLGNPIPAQSRFWTPGAIEAAAPLPNRLNSPNTLTTGWTIPASASLKTNQVDMFGGLGAEKITINNGQTNGEVRQARSYAAGPKTVRRGAFIKAVGVPSATLGKTGPVRFGGDINNGRDWFNIGEGLFEAPLTIGGSVDKLLWSRIQKRPNGYWFVMQEVELHPYFTRDNFCISPAQSYQDLIEEIDWVNPESWGPALGGNGSRGLIVDSLFEFLISEKHPDRPIVLVGDSHTMLQQSAQPLFELTRRPVINYGLSGQYDVDIPPRIGATPFTITLAGNQIPASGPVAVSSINPAMLTVPSLGAEMSILVKIAGVEGTLTTAGGTVTTDYTFTRKTPGSVVPVPANTQAFADAGTFNNGVAVIWVGANRSSTTGVAIQAVEDCVTWAQSKVGNRFIVLSVLTRGLAWTSPPEWEGTQGYDDVMAINAALKAAYPNNYLEVRDPLVAAYNPSLPGDVEAHEKDTLPASLMRDPTHLNEAGYQIVWELEAQFMSSKGWMIW